MKKLLALLILLPSITFGASILKPYQGGTGASTTPVFGQVLMGDGTGIYTPVATSSLGITGGGGGSPGGNGTDIQTNDGEGGFAGTDNFTWNGTMFSTLNSSDVSFNQQITSGDKTSRWLFGPGIGVSDGSWALRDETHTTNRITVDLTTGNVGIGTTGPVSLLDVNGTVSVNDTVAGLSNADLIVQGGNSTASSVGGTLNLKGGAAFDSSASAGSINLDAGAPNGGSQGVVNIAASNASSVFIGKATEVNSTLQIHDGSAQTGYVFTSTDDNGNGSWQAATGGSQTPWATDIDAASHDLNNVVNITGTSSASLTIKSGANQDTNIDTNDDNGSVIIGTNSDHIEMKQNTRFSGSLFMNNSNALFMNGVGDANWLIGLNPSYFTHSLATGNSIDVVTGGAPADGFAIGPNSGSSAFEISGNTLNAYFRGNVGIGTTTPTHALDVIGDANVSGTITAPLFEDPGLFNTLNFNDSNDVTLTIGSGGDFHVDAGIISDSLIKGDHFVATSTTATSTFAAAVKSPCFTNDGSTCITGGGGGVTVETPTGTVNGSNKVFTVSTTPLWIVDDGVTYFAGNGYTYAAPTTTMDVAPTAFIRSVHN